KNQQHPAILAQVQALAVVKQLRQQTLRAAARGTEGPSLRRQSPRQTTEFVFKHSLSRKFILRREFRYKVLHLKRPCERLDTEAHVSAATAVAGTRLTGFTQTPPLGRSDTLSSGTRFSCPGVSSRWNRCTRVATIRVISIMAKVLPMQTCGPAPKGK